MADRSTDAARGLHLFGALEFDGAYGAKPRFETTGAESLFAFLLIHARPFPRGVLAGKLWGDSTEAQARKRLRNALWRVKGTLTAAGWGEEALRVESDQVCLNAPAGAWIDIREFENQINSGPVPSAELTSREAENLERATGLYRGDLLEEVYEDWCVAERERLRSLFWDTLHRLLVFRMASDHWACSLRIGDLILQGDPLNEQVHRALMRAEYLRGNRAGALRRFWICEKTLDDELDIEPMAETLALFEAIRNQSLDPVPRSTLLQKQRGGPPLRRLRSARHALDQAAAHIDRTIKDLDHS